MSLDNRPNSVSAPFAEEIVSGFDIYKPEKLNTLFERYGSQGVGYFQALRTMGFEKSVAQDTYSHYELNRVHENFTALAGATASGAGAAITITLSPADLDAKNNYYPRRFDQVMLKSEKVGIIMSIDATTATAPVLTVLPNDETDVLAVGAGETVIIISGAFSEGSGQPKGAVRGSIEISNDAQIIKETIEATGSEMTRQTWVETTDLNNNVRAYYMLGQVDMDYRLSLKIDGAMLFGKRTTNDLAVDPDTGRPIKTTQGIVPAIRERGHDYPVAEGDFDVPEFDEIDRILDQEGASSYIMSMLGIKRHQEIENALYEYLQNTEESFATDVMATDLFGGGLDGKSKAVSVNFQSLFKSERKFLFKRMNNFNNPKTYGSEGYGMPNYAVMMPLSKSKEPRTGKPLESVGVRYRELGPYNRRMEVWTVGGAGEGLKVTEFDKRNWFQRVHVGAHHNKVNQMLLVSDVFQNS
jgi:hypothetical protein